MESSLPRLCRGFLLAFARLRSMGQQQGMGQALGQSGSPLEAEEGFEFPQSGLREIAAELVSVVRFRAEPSLQNVLAQGQIQTFLPADHLDPPTQKLQTLLHAFAA
jgi:CMP-N-acetylneuraminic acid synthetase